MIHIHSLFKISMLVLCLEESWYHNNHQNDILGRPSRISLSAGTRDARVLETTRVPANIHVETRNTRLAGVGGRGMKTGLVSVQVMLSVVAVAMKGIWKELGKEFSFASKEDFG
jgi:hypothetical protein